MKCPDCRDILKPVDCKGIVLNECPRCNGKWFERGELKRAQASEDDGLRWIDFDPFGKDAEQLSAASQGKACPECLENMQSLKYMKSDVVIDKCANCKGVWLEHGELAKIIRYLKDIVDREPAEALVKDTFKEFLKIFTGRQGIVSEIKDFFAVFYLLELRIAVEHPKLAETSANIYKSTPFR